MKKFHKHASSQEQQLSYQNLLEVVAAAACLRATLQAFKPLSLAVFASLHGPETFKASFVPYGHGMVKPPPFACLSMG